MSCGKTFYRIFVIEPTTKFKKDWAKTNRIDFLMYVKLFLQFSTFQTFAPSKYITGKWEIEWEDKERVEKKMRQCCVGVVYVILCIHQWDAKERTSFLDSNVVKRKCVCNLWSTDKKEHGIKHERAQIASKHIQFALSDLTFHTST